MTTNNKISHLVASQLPAFVREDDGNFTLFMEAYYQFLEQSGGVVEQTKNLRDNLDVDASFEAFTSHLQDMILKLIPQNVIADKNLILKHAKEFYNTRGTEKSVEFLMRILFNADVSIYYPKTDVIRASSGKWFIEKSLKVADITINGVANNSVITIKNFEGKRITGATSGAEATVEKIETYYEGGVLVREIKMSGQTKDFTPDEIVSAQFLEASIPKTIAARVFGAGIAGVRVVDRGAGYQVGQQVPVVSSTGSGAVLEISDVSRGNISALYVLYGGAGFRANDSLSITSDTGSGATGNVLSVVTTGITHPNSYNLVISSISAVATVNIGNNRYYSLNSALVDPANSWIANSMSYMAYSNTGPIFAVATINSGDGYLTLPTISVQANSRIRELGILGRMEIVSGGSNYAKGDNLVFVNPAGCYGMGAAANVTNVSVTGAITEVRFKPSTGYLTGGQGYSQDKLPSVTVTSASGTGAQITVTSLLGYGDNIQASSSLLGAINKIIIKSGGTGYESAPTIDLTSIGNGNATATATVVQGSYVYPGRYLNDDGQLSSYNFIQDRDYYQDFSYVVKTTKSLESYRKFLKDLIHPAGMKLFGEHLSESTISANTLTSNVVSSLILQSTYTSSANGLGTKIDIKIPRTIASISLTTLEFTSGNAVGNLSNGIFSATLNTSNSIIVFQANTKATRSNGSGNVYISI